jgi:hypothetical protein
LGQLAMFHHRAYVIVSIVLVLITQLYSSPLIVNEQSPTSINVRTLADQIDQGNLIDDADDQSADHAQVFDVVLNRSPAQDVCQCSPMVRISITSLLSPAELTLRSHCVLLQV